VMVISVISGILPLLLALATNVKSDLVAGDWLLQKGSMASMDIDVSSMLIHNHRNLTIYMMNGTVLKASIKTLVGLISSSIEVDEVSDAEDKILVDKNHHPEKEMMDTCRDFEGSLDIDPDSRLTITCDGSGILLTIVSQKYPFKRTSYRFSKKTGRPKRSAKKYKKPQGSLDLQSYRQLDNNTSGIWSALHKNKSAEFVAWKDTLESEQKLGFPEKFKIKKKVLGKVEKRYSSNTIEVAVITDPFLFQEVQSRFFKGNGTDDEVTLKIYSLVHEVLVSAQAFLMHPTIFDKGGFKLRLQGLRVLKDWEHLKKMEKRKLLISVLHDLANYLKIINHNWDGHYHSYDATLLLTGRSDFQDGDGYSYIGHVCLIDCPIVSKLMFEDDLLNMNMGRLIAHEFGHLLGADHDELVDGDDHVCGAGEFIMSTQVNSSMQAWSKCSRNSIIKNTKLRIEDYDCFRS